MAVWYPLISCHSCCLMKATFPPLVFILLVYLFVFKQSNPTPYKTMGWIRFMLMHVYAVWWIEHEASQSFSQKQYSPDCLMQQSSWLSCGVPSSLSLVQTLAWLALAQVSLLCARNFTEKMCPSLCIWQSAWSVLVSSPDIESPFDIHPVDVFYIWIIWSGTWYSW